MRPSAAQPTSPTVLLATAGPTRRLRTREASNRFARSQPAQAGAKRGAHSRPQQPATRRPGQRPAQRWALPNGPEPYVRAPSTPAPGGALGTSAGASQAAKIRLPAEKAPKCMEIAPLRGASLFNVLEDARENTIISPTLAFWHNISSSESVDFFGRWPKRCKSIGNYAQGYILGYTWRRRLQMGPRPLPWTRAPAVTPGPPKPQGGTLARNHCSKPTPGRYMAGRSCPSGSNLAQRRFSKPMPRSDSGVRAAKPNATRMETIRRHRRRSQAHRLLHGSACARLPSRCAQQARRNRHGGTPKRNNSKRHGSSAHSDPQSRHVTRQKGS